MTTIEQIRAALLAEGDETEKFRAALTALAALETEVVGWSRLFAAVVGQGLPGSPTLWPFDGPQDPAMVAFTIHQLRAKLAEIEAAPTVAKTLGNDHMHVNRDVARRLLIGTELVQRQQVTK